MSIELVHDENPRRFRVGGDRFLDMYHKVCFGACGTDRWNDDLTKGHFEIGDQGQRVVTDVLELAQLDPTGDHRARRMLAFQCLDARFLIRAHDVRAFPVQVQCLVVDVADELDFLIELLRVLWTVIGQPVTRQMRFQVRVLLKNAPHYVERCSWRCGA